MIVFRCNAQRPGTRSTGGLAQKSRALDQHHLHILLFLDLLEIPSGHRAISGKHLQSTL